MAVVFVAFLIIGLAMPVLPLHVHDGLGLGTFVVGLVAGSQFARLARLAVWAGRFSDSRGAKRRSSPACWPQLPQGSSTSCRSRSSPRPRVSVTILLLGRALLGAAESFIITGAVSWGMALRGPAEHRAV